MKHIHARNYLFNRNRVIVLSFIMTTLTEAFTHIASIDSIPGERRMKHMHALITYLTEISFFN